MRRTMILTATISSVLLMTLAACAVRPWAAQNSTAAKTPGVKSGGTAETPPVTAGEVTTAAPADETPSGPENPTEGTEDSTSGTDGTAAGGNNTAGHDILLTSAPDIDLSDVLSSTLNRYTVRSGNYSWTYLEGENAVEIVACGSHPLELNPEKAEKLKIKRYNNLEEAAYSVLCCVPPDRLTVREWDTSQLGSPEAKENSSVTYEDALLIKLKPDKVYEILAVWDEEKLQDNRFCGTAAYVVLTE